MRTPFLLLAISIISLNSSSLLFDGNGNFLHGKVYKANPATDLIEMKNGDYSLDGIGSVSEELQEKGYDVKAYNSGLVTQSRALTMAESNSSLYIYTYDKDVITNYTQVSISFTNPTRIDDDNKITYQPEFELKDIQLVSVSSNHYLAKWKVLNFKPDTTKGHSYYLRELIGKNYYLPAPIICQFDPQKGKTYEEYGEVVVIKDKFVAWQNFAHENVTKQPFQIDQMHYAVFNTNMDDQMDDLVKVEIEWDEQPFYGKTIVKKSGTNPSANDLTNANYYKLMDSDINFKGDMIHRKEVIENKNITYKSYDQFWFWKRDEKEWNINTVGKLQDLKDRNPNNEILTNENITNQKWFVTFKQNTFTAGTPYVQEVVGVFTKLSYYKDYYYLGLNNYDYTFNKTDPPIQMSPGIKRIYSEDEKRIENSVKHSINYSDSKSPYYVSKASILQLWFLHDGQIKNIVAVDTYTDSAGTSNIFDPTIMTFEDWFKSMTNWVRNLKDWFMKYWKWILIGILGVILLPIIISLLTTVPGLFTGIVKVFKFLVKGIWFIVSTPFKLIKWLFTPKNKTKKEGWN